MSASTEVVLWDRVVRLLHGVMAGGFIANYFLNEEGDDAHVLIGFAAAGAVLLRALWACTARGAAHYSDLFPSVRALSTHLQAIRDRRGYPRLGHTPLGAVVMLGMMTLMLMLGLTGFLMTEVDYFWGEEWIRDVHEVCANALLVLVTVHVSGALLESWWLGENLVKSMITGKRRVPATGTQD